MHANNQFAIAYDICKKYYMETLQFEVLNTDSSLVTERALCKFENGFGASVLRGHGSLTTATAPYELAIVKFYDDINFELIYPDFANRDVISSLSLEQVYSYLDIIKNL